MEALYVLHYGHNQINLKINKMKKLLLGALLVLSMTSCKKVAVSSSTEGNQVQVDLIFVKDDIKMYRFEDNGRYHYFTSRGETITSQTSGSGKNQTHYEENIQ